MVNVGKLAMSLKDWRWGMGYFDGLTGALFKKDASGDTLFYPWGVFGSGFIIKSEETREQIQKFYKKMYMVLLFVIVTIQVTVGFWLNAVLLPFYGVWYYFAAKKITKGLPRSPEKLRLAESYKNSAKSHNLTTLIIFEVFSVGFVAIGIWLLQSGQNQLVASASIGFFGLCGIAIGYMILVKIRQT